MKRYYARSELESIGAFTKSVGPSIEVTFKVVLSVSGSGDSEHIPDSLTAIHPLAVEGTLYWAQPKADSTYQYDHYYIGTSARHPWHGGYGTIPILGDPVSFDLLFPLRPDQLAILEEARAGGKCRFLLEVRILGYGIAKVSALAPAAPRERGEPLVDSSHEAIELDQVVSIDFKRTRVQQGRSELIEVEKSKWVEEMLPALGWNSARMVEVPMLPGVPAIDNIDKDLSEAERQFALGNWAASLTASRQVVEALKPIAEEHVNPVHSDTRGGPAPEKMKEWAESFEEMAKSMLVFQAATRRLMAAGAHAKPATLDLARADAELGLMVAVALRRYVGSSMTTGTGPGD